MEDENIKLEIQPITITKNVVPKIIFIIPWMIEKKKGK